MTTIQMDSHTGFTGNLTLPSPSGSVVAVTGGIGPVNGADVPLAIRSGWTVGPNEPWPGVRVMHLSAPPPPRGNWPTSGSITFPDGQTAAISGPIGTVGAITGGSAYTNGTYTNVPLTGGSGAGATGTITVSGGAVTAVQITNGGYRFLSTDTTVSAAAANIGGTGSGFSFAVGSLGRSDAVIPIAWVNQYIGYGWFATPYLSGLDL